MIEGEELALAIGMVSALSFNPLSLAARALTGGTISNDELPTASPTGVYGCARWGPLVGVLAGTRDPSDIGTSAASEINDLRRGGPGTPVRPLSFLSISARLVLALILLLMRGLKDEPSVSAAPRACTCPTTRSSPKGRRGSPLPNSTMPLGPVSWYRVPPLPGEVLSCVATNLRWYSSGYMLTTDGLGCNSISVIQGSHSFTSTLGSLSPNGLRR